RRRHTRFSRDWSSDVCSSDLLNTSMRDLYFKGKTYELLSLFFNRNENANAEQCPFLANEADVLKLRKAKNILIDKMAEPPSLPRSEERRVGKACRSRRYDTNE